MSARNDNRKWYSYMLEWAATGSSIAGAIALVMHRGGPAFEFFLLGSACWIAFGALHKYWGLVGCQVVFFVIDIIGIIRVLRDEWH